MQRGEGIAGICGAQRGEQAYLCGAQRGESRMWCAEGRAGSCSAQRGRAGVCDVQRVESLVGIHSRLISSFYGTGKLLVHNVEYCIVHNCKVVARQDRERDLKL